MKYEILALKYAGPVSSSGALLMWLKEWERREQRNYYIWCIRSHEEIVIVDAGVTPELARERNLNGYVNPKEVLSRIGVSADDVRHLVITHLHWDHASGVILFPNAVFYVQEREYYFWVKGSIANRPPFRYLSDHNSLAYLSSLEETDRLVLLKGDRPILNGIKCLYAPGHSIALQVVAVDTNKGTAIVGSDCAHLFRNYQEDWPSGIITDLAAWMRTYDKIRERHLHYLSFFQATTLLCPHNIQWWPQISPS
jgi:glyoxylase-like metal-dependent hydrolase (beta-lactamase superfamily II)